MLETFSQGITWGIIILFLMGTITGLYARGLTQYSARLARDGIDSQARLHSLETRTRSIYYQSGIRFSFPVDFANISYIDPKGKERKMEVEINKEFAQTLTPDTLIPIRFLPTAPGIMEIEPGRHAQDSRMVYFLAIIFWGSGTLALCKMMGWLPL